MAKVNVYIPDGLLEDIDALATERGVSRSLIVQEATGAYVASSNTVRAESLRQAEAARALESMGEIRSAEDMVPGTSSGVILRELRNAVSKDPKDER